MSLNVVILLEANGYEKMNKTVQELDELCSGDIYYAQLLFQAQPLGIMLWLVCLVAHKLKVKVHRPNVAFHNILCGPQTLQICINVFFK